MVGWRCKRCGEEVKTVHEREQPDWKYRGDGGNFGTG